MLKPSHYTTPRTLNDCTFASWADPIERPMKTEVPKSIKWYVAFLCISAIATIVYKFAN